MGCVQQQQSRQNNHKIQSKTIRKQNTPENKRQMIAELTASQPAKSGDSFKSYLKSIEEFEGELSTNKSKRSPIPAIVSEEITKNIHIPTVVNFDYGTLFTE